MHQDNKHKNSYDLDKLAEINTALIPFIHKGKSGRDTIDFSNPIAVKILNTALLQKYYGVRFWNFPDTNLCPPIPGRVDYIHYLNDLIEEMKLSQPIKILDVGIGATCIYPLLGEALYKWQFVGTDICDISLQNSKIIVEKNKLNESIELRKQQRPEHIFKTVIKENETFSASMCNPPFFKSEEEAQKANQRKQKNLNLKSKERNFSGNANELWYKGGEKAFIHNYLYESSLYKEQVKLFTILVSNKDLIRGMKVSLKKLGVKKVQIVKLELGNKISRIVAWTFL